MSNLDDLAQAMNRREITDEDGKIVEEKETPPEEEPTTEQKTTEEEDAQAEKPAKSEETDTQTEPKEDEIDLVELASDETGKKYVPETRFKEVYGKMKAYERKLEKEPKPKEVSPEPVIEQESLNKTDRVEVELLKATLPQFNPDNKKGYSREIDELGNAIYKANPGLTRIEAGKKAIDMAKKIQSKVNEVKQEARAVKSQQSDQGITSRVTSRKATSDVPKEGASDEELEEWLRASGQW